MLKKRLRKHSKERGLYIYITKEEAEINKLKVGDIVTIKK